MKNAYLFCSLLCCSSLAAQVQAPQRFTVDRGEVVMHVIPAEARYRFPTFQEGVILLYNDQTLPARLNYNRLFGEIQFITTEGDTLSPAQELLIKHLSIGQTHFYYDPQFGYVEEVAAYPGVKLAVRQVLRLIQGNIERANGYYGPAADFTDNLISEPPYQRHTAHALYNEKSPDRLVFLREDEFFLVDHNQRLHKVRKSTLRTLFPGHRRDLERYLHQQPTDFSKQDDLQRLLEFCSQLEQ
ncbi:hypothetical protein SAMN05421823_104278 [Catalinimonas alkaloidigena]|uniref:DUF4369 domain-containing protein n=1 Tax=Catalinimonas alkaloidigena TaxID=1075417 RepID=A0A1G9H0B2_9BACT|nr:hypothetical protein [Catalinimonas alkaloidigena]SDL06390.1 hypothetical protein SAMN05421823_104278 [Catalinimonas alkaloidigena]